MLREGRNTPRLLLLVFVFWVLSPFAALAWANRAAKGWAVATRATLYGVMLVLSLGSLAVYGNLIDVRPASASAAFRFVVVPPLSWLLLLVAVGAAALLSRRPSRRGAGA